MIDAMLTLAAYGFMVRMIVEGLQGILKISGSQSPQLVKALAVGVSAIFVYLVGINPVALLAMGKVKVVLDGAAVAPVGVALLAGAAMGSNDFADFFKNVGKVR